MPKKPISDDPQGRIELRSWIVGFVDGEGSFVVSLFKSPKTKIGWQVFPEFSVSQSKKNLEALKELKRFFGCGNIYSQKSGRKEKWDRLYKFCVRNRKDLLEKIVPFFQKYPLQTKSKQRDFEIFVKVLKKLEGKKRLKIEHLREIAKLVSKMTHRKPFSESKAAQFLFPSETVRRGSARVRNKIQSDPCGDAGRMA